MPEEVANSFTPDQLLAVQRAFGMRYVMPHAVDMRRTVRLPWGCFYVVVLAGWDMRHSAPRVASFAPYIAAGAAVGAVTAALMLMI